MTKIFIPRRPSRSAHVDDEEEEDDWSITPSSIANIRNMTRLQDPSLAFLPKPAYTQSGFYAAGGGIARLANGGEPANAQAILTLGCTRG